MPEQQENQTEVFHLKAPFKPTGDQPQAIEALVQGLKAGDKGQTLLGVTGSGKTFTMANIIAQCNRPTLILEPNKTLASQICTEMRGFFPDDAVEYFVSYYDYYQPEAYIPSTDTYIEKDSAINDEIDRLRHSATAALSEQRNVIIVRRFPAFIPWATLSITAAWSSACAPVCRWSGTSSAAAWSSCNMNATI